MVKKITDEIMDTITKLKFICLIRILSRPDIVIDKVRFNLPTRSECRPNTYDDKHLSSF